MSSVRVANYFGTTGELQLLNQTIIWPGDTTEIPLGRPKCGFDNEFCKVEAKGKKKKKLLNIIPPLYRINQVFLSSKHVHGYIFCAYP